MAIKNEKGFWIDPKGGQVPVKYIDKQDKDRDRMVEKAIKKAMALSDIIASTKKELCGIIDDYISEVSKTNGVSKDWKGNISMRDFSHQFEIQVKINETIKFNEQLQVAKELIDECIREWSDGANDKLLVLIRDAFNTDKAGNIDSRRILSLRKHKIKDDRWKAAMEKITAAMEVEGTKRYINFKKKNENGDWENVNLNFAAV